MPDKLGVEPKTFFGWEKALAYENNKSINKIQVLMARRLSALMKLKKDDIILDLGCGTGIASNFLREFSSRVIGLDLSLEMLYFTQKKKVEAINADFQHIPFRESVFDAVVSVSSLQWVWGSTASGVLGKYNTIIRQIRSIVKADSVIGVQFYPQTAQEFNAVADIFRKNGFEGKIIIDEPQTPKKTKRYLILKIRGMKK